MTAGSGKGEEGSGTARRGSVPPELEAAMRDAVGENSSPTASDLLSAAERLLDRVLTADCESRSSAIDLLTVDALITHALEVAATESVAISSFADDAMARIALHSH